MRHQEEVKREAVEEVRAGLREEWAQAPPPGPAVVVKKVIVRGGGRSCGCCCGPMAAAAIGLFVLVSNAPRGDRLRNVREVAHLAGVKLKPEDLATFRDQQRAVLDAPLPAGPFDPGLQAEWALGIARQWSPEARLTGIRAVRVRRDGSVDPADARAETTFVFESATKVQESLAKDARNAAELNHGLSLRVAQNRVEARLAFGYAPKLLPPTASTLPLGRLLELARASHRLPDQPVYQATLSVENGLALWRLEAIATPASVFMRASDGRLLR